ncbi:MAG: FecR domain-containing protein [Opitutaceae bacterium]
MKRPEPESPEADRRSQEAAEWLVRRDRGLTAAEQDEFLQWLAADPRHGEWLALHRAVVADFTALARWRPEHSNEPNPDLLAPRRPRVRWFAPAALAAAAVITVAFVLWHGGASSPVQPLARRLLEDGSSVELNRGAVVRDAFTANERRVELVSGEAYFSVTKNSERAFVVRAGGVAVRAIGTAFSVRLDASIVEVIVTEGQVGVTREEDPVRSTTVAGEKTTLVDAGQKATIPLVAAVAPAVRPATPEQISRHLGWQAQLLDFSSAPLAVAVAEFNRRNRVQFEIADAELAAMPVVASIHSENVEGFVQFLAAAPGVQIERRGDETIILRRKR